MLETWPPPYKLRKSKRAKNISLKVTLQAGLEVIVPDNLRYKKYHNKDCYVEEFLQQNKRWILKHGKVIVESSKPVILPTKLHLNSLRECWKIKYLALTKNSILSLDSTNTIIITYNKLLSEDKKEIVVNKVLVNWLKIKASSYLKQRAVFLADKFNFTVNKVDIKSQKTLWGSCDNQKNINLNFKLIFLPIALSDHVIIHELCHTKYMNHSKKFWQLLGQLDIDCESNKKYLKTAENYIPNFI